MHPPCARAVETLGEGDSTNGRMTGFGQNTPLAAERPAWYTHSMDDVRGALAANLAELRKEENLTQAEFAAQFNYSDKAVSKWERGDSLPDVVMLKTIADLCIRYDVYAIMDEVYEHIIYKPSVHTYFAALPGMRERTIVCNSLSKTYSITGWRLGYVLGPAEALDRVRKVHDFLTVGAAAPLQEAVVTALNFDDSYYQEVLDLYTAKRDLFCQGLDSIGLEHNVPQGAYYVMMDISEFGYDSDLEFCEDLASKVGVGAVPGSSFFREPVNHLIRFHFAKRDETLNAALENLKSLRDKIKPRG